MKWNYQTKYFINGVILVLIALFCVTFLPSLINDKTNFIISNYVFAQVEFFTLCAAIIFFLFSPKYYKGQIILFILGAIYYILFVKLYSPL